MHTSPYPCAAAHKLVAGVDARGEPAGWRTATAEPKQEAMILRNAAVVLAVAAVLGLTAPGRAAVFAVAGWIHNGFVAVFIDASSFVAGCF